jgi:hypothetical protein
MEVFPEWTALLCTWHANKSINQHCKSHFTDKEFKEFIGGWNGIATAPTIELYKEAVHKFKIKWSPTHLADITYIENNWLIPNNRDKIMRAYTNDHLHLGNTTTSRVEGIHFIVKQDLGSKKCDLLYAWDVIDKVARRQLDNLNDNQGEQKSGRKAHYQFKIFDNVRKYVSYKALDLTYAQFNMARQTGPNNEPFDYTNCTGRYTKTMGLPCKCTIAQRLQAAPPRPLRLEDFHSAWCLRTFREEERIPILPPRKLDNRRLAGRPTGAKNKRTTRMESGFEKSAGEQAQKEAKEAGVSLVQCSACAPSNYTSSWGHRKSQHNCPSHSKHQEWLDKPKKKADKQKKKASKESSQPESSSSRRPSRSKSKAIVIESSSESDNELEEEPQEEEPEEDSNSDSILSPSPRSPHLTDNGEDLVEEEQDQDVDMELDPYEEAIMAWEEKRQQSTDWCSVLYKYLECINGDPVHPEELNALGRKEVFDAVRNEDGYLYHSQQEGRSERRDHYELTEGRLIREQAKKAVADVEIPPLSPLPTQRKRGRPSKKQQQLGEEAEQERQEQHQKKQRKLLEDQKFIELKDAQDREEEQQQAQFKETIERWQKRWPRQEKKTP